MLKFKTSERNVFFTSDPHMDHDKNFVWEVRGYKSAHEHKEGVIKKWNEVVTPNDIVISLGDFQFGKDGEKNMLETLQRLNFSEIFLIQGNHGSGWKQLKQNRGRNFELGGKKVNLSPDYMEVVVDNQPIVLCHYPIVSFNGQGKGSWMLFGHTHQNIYKSEIGALLKKLKMMDVGIDYCGRPLSFNEIKEIMDSRPLHSFDHHDSKTQNPF